MRLALAQLEIEAGKVTNNVERGLDAVERAASAGSDLVALPELFDVGYFAFDSYGRAADSLGGDRLERFRRAAVEHDIAVLAGTIVEDLAATAAEGEAVPESSGLANTAVLFDADGNRRLVYRKHHLFGYGSEGRERFVPGESLPVADIGGHTVGVTTCYDLRFPELYRELLESGVTLVVVPSAWPYPRVEHWKLLPRARSIENLCYVGAVNGSATFEDGLVGRSAVYDPWGTTLAATGEEPSMVYADVDPERVSSVRSEFPALSDRR
ncbi:MAG: nitrilase-related carbon-nitrogen hydrolase [Natronomonas sp.]